MKKNIFYFVPVMTIALSVPGIKAQNMIQQGNVTVQTNKLEQCGDSLYLDMILTLHGKNVSSRRSADFTPVLATEAQTKRLPKISVKGRKSYKSYRRAVALMSRKEQMLYTQSAPYKVVRGYKKAERVVDYKVAVPYEKWMSSAILNLEKDDCGCGKSRTTDVKMLANKVNLEKIIIVERYNITPSLAYIQPAAEVEKNRVEQGVSYLDFAVGRTDINPSFGANERELQKIRRIIGLVQSDKGSTIKGIEITGYASPEGSLATNERLSEGRAKALRSYLEKQYSDIPASLYSVHFGGENWADLLTAVKASDMQYKQEVIDIIEGYSVNAGREKKLMMLKSGSPYRYMLKEMFPALRKVTVAIDYKVKNFDLKEAIEVSKTRPQNLSLNEMFVVAQTYEKGSQEFNDLFETAVRMFPEDATANINAAVAAIGRHDYVSADRYLKNVKVRARIPEYDNAMGMLVMMRDSDYEKAESYFKAAGQAGLVAAEENLKEIAKMRENISAIKEAQLKQKR